jgi:hypothetical protein
VSAALPRTEADIVSPRWLQVISFMRFIMGFLSGVLGLLAGWIGLAALVIALAGPGRDGGIAMQAFFVIGPIGGVVGFVAGVLLFVKLGSASRKPSPKRKTST